MPGFTDVTKVIEADWWAEEEEAEIRRFAYGDRKFLTGKYVETCEELGIEPQEAGVRGELLETMNNLTILRAVVRWTGPDGEEVEVTMESVRALDERDGDFILAEIQAFNEAMGEDERETFRGAGGTGA